MPGAEVRWQGGTQSIAWAGAASLYLAQSYSLLCLPGVKLRYPVRIEVTQGALGIGVLSEDFSSWVETFRFDKGHHDATLEVDVGPNARVRLVLYSCQEGRLEAAVDWSEAMRPRVLAAGERERLLAAACRIAERASKPVGPDPVAADKLARRAAMAAAKAALPAKAAEHVATGAPEAAPPRRRGGRWLRLVHDPRPIHCHKPWTDLHNFTVDGRMDVCCIATGASQQRFALGNLNRQSFQEVWNGAVAREFRRTVNEPGKALPPCQRCPMAQAYQGPLLEPNYTGFQAWRRTKPHRVVGSGIARRLHAAAFLALYAPLHLWLFRGFERAERLPLSALRRWYRDVE
jgi:radical SAM protein with 4Fe4S-binding SPASM domain